MHSHHSHSGSFCQHAKDTLEEMVLRAIELGFQRFCLTEHMPRIAESHLYPEELESQTTVSDLERTFDEYFREGRRLQAKYASDIELLVGFESEAMDEVYVSLVGELTHKYKPDLVVGSVHHVGSIPIDFNADMWSDACKESGGIEETYARYFDQQYRLIVQQNPSVIGHFDVIRLYSPPFDLTKSEIVYPKVVRNVKAAVERSCLFELNSAALAKGWSSPYPQQDIVRLILSCGGRFCLSDDSHSVAQVARHYGQLADYLDALGINQVWSVGDHPPLDVEAFRHWGGRYLGPEKRLFSE